MKLHSMVGLFRERSQLQDPWVVADNGYGPARRLARKVCGRVMERIWYGIGYRTKVCTWQQVWSRVHRKLRRGDQP